MRDHGLQETKDAPSSSFPNPTHMLLCLCLAIKLCSSSSSHSSSPSPRSLLFSVSTVANGGATTATSDPEEFKEAPEFYHSPTCPSLLNTSSDSNSYDDSDGGSADDDVICLKTAVHMAMTPYAAAYTWDSVVAILSILQYSTCPQNVIFHFVYSATTSSASLLRATFSSSFSYLRFQLHPFEASAVSTNKQK